MAQKKQRVRPNPETYSIIDDCPGCGFQYGWNSCEDTYVGSKEVVQSIAGPRTGEKLNYRSVCLFVCPNCDCTIAIMLADNRGAEVYVPTKKEL